jgi:hypothetical protein
MKPPETLRALLKISATVRAQKTATPEPSITPSPVEQGLADINRRFHLVPEIFSQFTFVPHNSYSPCDTLYMVLYCRFALIWREKMGYFGQALSRKD